MFAPNVWEDMLFLHLMSARLVQFVVVDALVALVVQDVQLVLMECISIKTSNANSIASIHAKHAPSLIHSNVLHAYWVILYQVLHALLILLATLMEIASHVL